MALRAALEFLEAQTAMGVIVLNFSYKAAAKIVLITSALSLLLSACGSPLESKAEKQDRATCHTWLEKDKSYLADFPERIILFRQEKWARILDENGFLRDQLLNYRKLMHSSTKSRDTGSENENSLKPLKPIFLTTDAQKAQRILNNVKAACFRLK